MFPQGMFVVVLLVSFVARSAGTLLTACATPEAGFWEMDGDSTKLTNLVEQHGGNFSVDCHSVGSVNEVGQLYV